MYSPKSIVMNVSLNGFDKEIKRKIIVNNNILVDKFCRAVIVSMQGEIDHLYTVKFNKRLSDENILDEKLSYLELSVGSKFKVIYDYGDNWQFNVRVSKVNSGFHDKEFEILSGLSQNTNNTHFFLDVNYLPSFAYLHISVTHLN